MLVGLLGAGFSASDPLAAAPPNATACAARARASGRRPQSQQPGTRCSHRSPARSAAGRLPDSGGAQLPAIPLASLRPGVGDSKPTRLIESLHQLIKGSIVGSVHQAPVAHRQPRTMASPYAAADNTRLHVELRQAEQRWRRWQPAPRDVQPYVMPSVGTSAYVAARQTAGGADLLGGLTRYFGAATRTPTAVYADVPSPEPARPQTRASLRPPDARTAAGRRKHDEARRGYAGALRARRTPGTSTVAHSPAMRAASPHDHLPPMTPGGFTPGVSAVSSRAASIAPSPAASEWQHALAAPSPRVPASSAAAAATGHTDGDEYFFRIETASPIASGHFGAVWRVLRMRRPGRRLATGMRPPDEVVGTQCAWPAGSD